MIAGDIISEIIKRMKFWGSRFPDATTSFIPDTRGNSWFHIASGPMVFITKLTIKLFNYI